MRASLGTRVRHIIGDAFGASIVEANLEKAIQAAKENASAPKAEFYDPLSLFFGKEWVAKPSHLTPKDLRGMAKNPIISSIVGTRAAQVAAFCQPQQDTYEIGFRVIPVDPNKDPSPEEVYPLQAWLMTVGVPGWGERSLEAWARKFIMDSLILDQATSEVVLARNRLPAYLKVVDAASIRKLKNALTADPRERASRPSYVQIIHDKVVASFMEDEMIFGVRNPQTSLESMGYGESELEVLIRTVTTILNTERLNSSMLTQGGTAKGVLVVAGDADPTQFENFKRDFREAIRNAAMYWRAPVLRVGKDSQVDWVELDRSNRDMEYAQLFDFLVKQACGVYQIDPEEINWQIGSTGSQTVFESRKDMKAYTSQRKGLKPLLNFLGSELTTILRRLNPEYRMEFVGLTRTREEDAELRERETQNYKMINETRAELGWDPIPGGNIVLSDIYLKYLEMLMERNIPIPQGDGKSNPDFDLEYMQSLLGE